MSHKLKLWKQFGNMILQNWKRRVFWQLYFWFFSDLLQLIFILFSSLYFLCSCWLIAIKHLIALWLHCSIIPRIFYSVWLFRDFKIYFFGHFDHFWFHRQYLSNLTGIYPGEHIVLNIRVSLKAFQIICFSAISKDSFMPHCASSTMP